MIINATERFERKKVLDKSKARIAQVNGHILDHINEDQMLLRQCIQMIIDSEQSDDASTREACKDVMTTIVGIAHGNRVCDPDMAAALATGFMDAIEELSQLRGDQ